MKELLTIRFTGRLQRRDFWLSICGLVVLFFGMVRVMVDLAIDRMMSMGVLFRMITTEHHPGIFVLTGVVLAVSLFIYVFLLGLGYGARRLHDIGMSGWCQLLVLIPGIGDIALIVMFCLDGQRGTNRWGENPKEVEFEITRLAAEQGYAAAQSRLALYYETGMGVKRNKAEAKMWRSRERR